jgi:threonine dehydrogenase-like Zn-dependent dehydrogenase
MHSNVIDVLYDDTWIQYITLPIRNLHLIPDSIDDETAVFVEPLAAACRIIEQKVINVNTDRVAVIGDGKLGLLVMFTPAFTVVVARLV